MHVTASAGAADVLARAQHMQPWLRERQAECEALGRIPEATHQAFVEAGLYRLLQPRRFGGLELTLGEFFETMAAIARGCGSSGWVLALTAGHAHTLAALFPEQTQVEIFGPDGEFRAPFSANGSATCTPVRGGYRLSGSWNYVSGCEIATHYMGLASLGDQRVFVLIARDDFSIEKDWDVLGMRGTGSHRVNVNDVFVPAARVIPQALDFEGSVSAPGRGVHPNPMYAAGRIGSVLWGEMAAVAVGMAQGALDVYEEDLRSKRLSYPPFLTRAEVPEFQRHFGRAWSMAAMASAALARVGADYMENARAQIEDGVPFSDVRDSELRLQEQQITLLAADAVDRMLQTAGTSATRASAPLQRFFRDIAMIRTHHAAQIDRGAEEFGRAYLTSDAAPRAL